MSTSLDTPVSHREPQYRSTAAARTPSQSVRKRSWLPLSLLAIVLAMGSYMRLAHLERGDFREDELFQYYVAESLERGEGPRLPSGEIYTRGIDVSHMVRLSIRELGPTPTAIRLPSALLGTLGLFIFAGALWAMAGPWAAVAGTLMLTIYPEAVSQSRQLRFYTYQMVFGLLAFYTGWRALRGAGAQEEPGRAAFRQQWLWAIATVVLLLLAARVQVVSLSILAGWGACVAAAAIADAIARGRGAWRRSMPLQLMMIGVVALIAVLIAEPGTLAHLVQRAQTAPRWVLYGDQTDPLAYYAMLRANYPVLLSLSPLIFIGAIVLRPRLGVYLLVWFAVPMLLHSFVLTWKGQRFVLAAVPALFGAAAICAAWGGSALHTLVTTTAQRWHVPAALRYPLAYAAVALTAVSLIVTTPATMESRALARGVRMGDSNWRDVSAIIRARPDLASVPIGVTYTLHGLYYLPRVDFAVRINGLERRTYRAPDGTWRVEYNPMGSPEYKVGLPVLTTPEAIEQRFADAGAVLINFTTSALSVSNVEQSLYDRLEAEAVDLCKGRCDPANRLYLWRFGGAQAESSPESLGAEVAGTPDR